MRSLGRGIKFILILTLVLLLLTIGTGLVMKNVLDYEDTTEVLVFKENYLKGEMIDIENIDDYVKTIKVSKLEVPETIIVEKEELADYYFNEDIYKGEFVTSNTVNEVYPFRIKYDIPEGYSLVSLKFERGDSANAWNVFEGQEILLIYSPSTTLANNIDASVYLKEKSVDATIYSIKDSQYYMQGELEYNPSKLLYITFLVKDNQALFLSRAKDKGRIDIIQ